MVSWAFVLLDSSDSISRWNIYHFIWDILVFTKDGLIMLIECIFTGLVLQCTDRFTFKISIT